MKNNNIVIGCIVSTLVTGGAGFYGGTVYAQKIRTTGRTGQFTNGSGRGMSNDNRNIYGSAQPGTMRGGAVVGEVTAKDDKSLTIKLPDGSSRIVILSSSTTYRRTSDSSANDISIGTKVSTFGSANTDGSVTAQNVQIDPSMPPATPVSK